MDSHSPSEFADHLSQPLSVGSVSRSWIQEEFRQAARFGIRYLEECHTEQSEFQKICVYKTDFFGTVLTLDDLVMCTERDEFVYHEMLAHVPLCSHPKAKDVLVIGGGDCGVVREVLKHPGVERVVQCEIDERVTAVCRDWFSWVKEIEEDSRVELSFGDGVKTIEAHENAFDLIVVDSTDPIGPAVGLFLRDFYKKVKKALRPDGIMVAQTESPHWGTDLMGPMYREIRSAFKNVAAYWGAIPTYPSGSWTWAYASEDREPFEHFDQVRADAMSADCQYYNAELHRGSFALPNFVRRALND